MPRLRHTPMATQTTGIRYDGHACEQASCSTAPYPEVFICTVTRPPVSRIHLYLACDRQVVASSATGWLTLVTSTDLHRRVRWIYRRTMQISQQSGNVVVLGAGPQTNTNPQQNGGNVVVLGSGLQNNTNSQQIGNVIVAGSQNNLNSQQNGNSVVVGLQNNSNSQQNWNTIVLNKNTNSQQSSSTLQNSGSTGQNLGSSGNPKMVTVFSSYSRTIEYPQKQQSSSSSQNSGSVSQNLGSSNLASSSSAFTSTASGNSTSPDQQRSQASVSQDVKPALDRAVVDLISGLGASKSGSNNSDTGSSSAAVSPPPSNNDPTKPKSVPSAPVKKPQGMSTGLSKHVEQMENLRKELQEIQKKIKASAQTSGSTSGSTVNISTKFGLQSQMRSAALKYRELRAKKLRERLHGQSSAGIQSQSGAQGNSADLNGGSCHGSALQSSGTSVQGSSANPLQSTGGLHGDGGNHSNSNTQKDIHNQMSARLRTSLNSMFSSFSQRQRQTAMSRSYSSGFRPLSSQTSDSTDSMPTKTQHKMFLSRVLVGRYTGGSASLRKPPPLDEVNDPYGKLL